MAWRRSRGLPDAPVWVGLITFAIAAWSAAPGVHWLDTGELTAAGLWLGVPHPPGHPLYVLLARLAALLPAGAGPVRISWASAAALGLAWAAVCWTARRLLVAHLGLRPALAGWLAALPALGGSLAAASLLQGVRAEVYALHAALVLWALGLLLAGRPELRTRLAAVLLASLALANHHYLVLLTLPGLALAWWGAWRSGRSSVVQRGGQRATSDRPPLLGRELPLTLLVGLAGLLPYLFLPLRAASATPLAWGDPRTPGRFFWVISASVFQKAVRAGPAELLHNLAESWLMLMEPLHPVGFAAALVGVGLLARRNLAAAGALVLVAGGTALSQSLFGIDPFNPDLHGYFLAAVGVLAVAASYCAGWLAAATGEVRVRGERVRAHATRAIQAVLLALLACLPLRSLARAGEPLAFARLAAPEAVARATLAALLPHAVAVTADFSTVFLLWGARAAERSRPDVTIVHRNYLPFPGWVEREARFHPELEPLMRLLQQPGAVFPPGGPPLARPLYIEPYHNLEPAIADGLRPAGGLLHRWAPGEPLPLAAPPAFWDRLDAALTPRDLADPQTRRYLFWQHVLQGQQYAGLGAAEAALQEYRRALELAPGSPEVLELVREIVEPGPLR